MELLLAVAMVLMLVSAAIFSFSTLLRGSRLAEGADQVESLIRFARAQAANTGRKVQINFDEETDAESLAVNIRVSWEPDPLGDPGTFEPLAAAAWQVQAVNELIQIEAARLLDSPVEAAWNSSTEASEQSPGSRPFSPITFYPDGSSDSAEIILVARSSDEAQQMSVRVEGLTGAIRHEIVSAAPGEETAPADPSELRQNKPVGN